MVCKVIDCGKRVMVKRHQLCQTHYHRFRSNGHTELLKAERVCDVCRTVFSVSGSAVANAKCCSEACGIKAHTKRAQERAGNAAYMKRYKWAWKLKNMYGITPEQYEIMRSSQGGRCAICAKHEIELGEILVVDHDHKTGKARALLCRGCNRGIGSFGDDADLLLKAAAYLATSGDSILQVV